MSVLYTITSQGHSGPQERRSGASRAREQRCQCGAAVGQSWVACHYLISLLLPKHSSLGDLSLLGTSSPNPTNFFFHTHTKMLA